MAKKRVDANNQAHRDNAANQRASAKQMRDSSDEMRRQDTERRALVAAKREMSKPRVAKSAREDRSHAGFRVVREITEKH